MRPGGRVLTARDPFADGFSAELGAARIPETHDLVIAYAARFGLSLVPFWPEPRDEVHLVRGRRVRVAAGAPWDFAAHGLDVTEREQRLGPAGLHGEVFGPLLARAGDARAAAWPPECLRALDAQSMYAYARNRGTSPDAILLFGLGFAEPEVPATALLALLREEALTPFGAGMRKIAGGMDALPKAMAACAPRLHPLRGARRPDRAGRSRRAPPRRRRRRGGGGPGRSRRGRGPLPGPPRRRLRAGALGGEAARHPGAELLPPDARRAPGAEPGIPRRIQRLREDRPPVRDLAHDVGPTRRARHRLRLHQGPCVVAPGGDERRRSRRVRRATPMPCSRGWRGRWRGASRSAGARTRGRAVPSRSARRDR